MARVAVIGAGLSGLVRAHALQRAGHEVTVLEASERAGGVIQSVSRQGYLLDTGANSFVDRLPEARALFDELGLTSQLLPAAPLAKRRYVAWRGRLEAVPGSPGGLLRTPLLSASGKARLLLEPVLARRHTGADESLEEFGRRHLGDEATARLLDAMQVGTFAGMVSELSAESAFPNLVAMEREGRSLVVGQMKLAKRTPPSERRGPMCSFRDGMGTLPRALAARLGDVVQLNTPVQALARIGDGWTLRTPRRDYQADRVVLATAPHVTAQLLAPLDPVMARALEGIPTAPVAMVHLGVPRERVAHALDGFGFVVPALEGRATLGCIFSSSVFAGRAPEGMVLLTVLLGGRRRPELVEYGEVSVVAQVRDELRGLIGLDGEPEMVHAIAHKKGIPQYTLGHQARLDTLAEHLRSQAGLSLLGWGYKGVGVLDCIREGLKLD
jgi:oxygen-dependent protoporphyrinogen oxidase